MEQVGVLGASCQLQQYAIPFRPSLLLVGNVTVDVVDGKHVAVRVVALMICLLAQLSPNKGGAVTYAAVVAAAHGQRACIVTGTPSHWGICDNHDTINECQNTAAGPDADLSALRGHSLHVIQADKTLTFEHTYTWWGAWVHGHATTTTTNHSHRRQPPQASCLCTTQRDPGCSARPMALSPCTHHRPGTSHCQRRGRCLLPAAWLAGPSRPSGTHGTGLAAHPGAGHRTGPVTQTAI